MTRSTFAKTVLVMLGAAVYMNGVPRLGFLSPELRSWLMLPFNGAALGGLLLIGAFAVLAVGLDAGRAGRTSKEG